MELSINNASKKFGKKNIFNDLNLNIRTGEIIGLFGKNGAGKSTFLKMIFGLISGSSIDIRIDDKVILPSQVIPQKIISYLPQERFLPVSTRVRDIIPMYFRDSETLDKIFYTPWIPDIEGLKFGSLSEGQKKYVEILLISHLDHPFMILDEPFSMVDPKFSELLKTILSNLNKDKGILITDHYYEDVLQISDRNYLMKDGGIYNVVGEKELIDLGYLSNREK